MKKTKKVFEENYFEGYYHGIADFSKQRDKELTNWFLGMFSYIEHQYPLSKGKRKKLIEFGCATGASSSLLRDFGYKVSATDISKYAVDRAKKNHKKIEFFVHDMQKALATKKNYFDVAVAFDVVEHLKKPEVALKHVYNMLKPGGTVILTTPNDYPHIYNDPTHINVKKPEDWKKILEEIGYKNIFMKQVTFIPYLYRFHWRFNFAIPLATASPYFISPVFIIAKK